mmetsp:Transcript_8569/g.28026  ORF Transcript_8569/g.28026 Transcript_8569/m.28026 type:complete len:209 (-) Transcript_8569:457-1083(-)
MPSSVPALARPAPGAHRSLPPRAPFPSRSRLTRLIRGVVLGAREVPEGRKGRKFPTYREVKLLSSLSSLVYYDWVGDGVDHWDTYRSPPSAAFREEPGLTRLLGDPKALREGVLESCSAVRTLMHLPGASVDGIKVAVLETQDPDWIVVVFRGTVPTLSRDLLSNIGLLQPLANADLPSVFATHDFGNPRAVPRGGCNPSHMPLSLGA